LTTEGSVFLDEAPVETQNLAERLRVMAGDEKEPAVLLFADNRITYQTLYAVIDQIKLAGIDRLSLECERQP
jgi:biopolymer transport protein ExbD